MHGSEKPDAHIIITHFSLSSEMQRSQTGAGLQAATNALSKGGWVYLVLLGVDNSDNFVFKHNQSSKQFLWKTLKKYLSD